MALWGFAFGFAATVTGVYVMTAIEGGFLAEGFFLVVVLWVVILVIVAKIATLLERK